MDNISRRQSNEDTTTSMYLSFDAESTMSTACYRTFDALSDVSAISVNDLNNSSNRNEIGNSDLNRTLEIRDDSKNITPLKTVKKNNIVDDLPLRVLPKSVLKEYNALCSTPSKKSLLEVVDFIRSSDTSRCEDLGLAFSCIENKDAGYNPQPPILMHEENKENALPENEELFSLSTSSTVEITSSVIEKKMSPISTVDSIHESNSIEEAKVINNTFKNKSSLDDVDKSVNIYCSLSSNIDNDMHVEKQTKFENEIPKKSKVKVDGDIVKGPLATHYEEVSLTKEKEIVGKNGNNELSTSAKKKLSVLPRITRRSNCEPNLLLNKHLKISNSDNKRRSLLPTSNKSTLKMNAELEIPLLMSQMLRITKTSVEPPDNKKLNGKKTAKHQRLSLADVRRSNMPSSKMRASLIPSAAANKRPFHFTQRMSTVVKTTLNSPARKVPRKSLISAGMLSLQRSVIPQKVTATDDSNAEKSNILSHKITVSNSYSNVRDQASSKSQNCEETCSKTTSTKRNPSYALSKELEKRKIASDMTYTCNVCKEKFRIKSLLDAHKRSHESDNVAPAFIKKPTPITQTVLGTTNQCKYCDRKFALLKALHIHLLQNCIKIPPSEKRKLQYTDLQHVEKAQLPNVFSHNFQSSASSSASSASDTPRFSVKQIITTTPKASVDSWTEKEDMRKFISNLPTRINGNNVVTLHSGIQKNKKITAHAGIYKTPSKSVPCHLCKLTFKSILEYTDHNLTTHGNRKPVDTSKSNITKRSA